MQENNAEIVLSSHDYLYERFAPQDANGKADARGIRQFTVGTGGAPLYSITTRQANSEVIQNRVYGVLKMTLKPGSYEWEFIPIAGQSFRDSGVDQCH